MSLRRIVFWVHLSGGIVAGAVIFLMCATGMLLAFERQINGWADARNRLPVRARNEPRRNLSNTVDRLKSAGQLTDLTIYADPKMPVAIGFSRKRTIFADPYTGEKVGENSKISREFFERVEGWHRALGQSVQARGLGRAVAAHVRSSSAG